MYIYIYVALRFKALAYRMLYLHVSGMWVCKYVCTINLHVYIDIYKHIYIICTKAHECIIDRDDTLCFPYDKVYTPCTCSHAMSYTYMCVH